MKVIGQRSPCYFHGFCIVYLISDLEVRGLEGQGQRSNKESKQRQVGSNQHQVPSLPPTSGVEVIKTEPSVCLLTYLTYGHHNFFW